MPVSGSALEPATHRSLVRGILGGKASLQVSLLLRDHHERDDGHRGKQRGNQPYAVYRKGNSELEQREGQIDGIAAETIGPSPHYGRRGLIARDRRARGSEAANGPYEQADCQQNYEQAKERTHATLQKRHWPDEMKNEAECYGSQVHQRGTDNPQVCGLGHWSDGVRTRSKIGCHASLTLSA